jgi:hypothetical protein
VACRSKFDLGENFGPLDILSLDITFRAESTFDGSSGCVVTGEEAGIDVETNERTSKT